MGCPEEWAQARRKNGRDVMGQLHLALIPAHVWAPLSDCCPLSLAGAALPGGQTWQLQLEDSPLLLAPTSLSLLSYKPQTKHVAPMLYPLRQPSLPRLCSRWIGRNLK